MPSSFYYTDHCQTWEHCEGYVFFFFWISPMLSIQFNHHCSGTSYWELELTATCLHGPSTTSLTDHRSTTGYSARSFRLHPADFRHNTSSCHMQKFSDNTAIVGRVSEENNQEYWEVICDFVNWFVSNHLHITASKTKEMVVDFRRRLPRTSPVNIQGANIEMVETYKYLGVHLNNKLDWSKNTDVLYKKGQSCLHLLRRLSFFGVCRTLLKTFYDTEVASAIFYAVVCWEPGSPERDRKRLNRLVKRATSVLACPLDTIEKVRERRKLAKLASIMGNTAHPLHEAVSSFFILFNV
ncbi:uncharacterized protein LOC116062024 [Sander lucioperca]|uniref:uncharacterized protein LOC116062024 n=1 Tax=Sander lucioperca TaxID=283035 RepID=UPI001653C374|nr:uncharacterized protein LOC116062024 [Sander lucioperca]